MASPVIEFQNVSFRYDKIPILNQVSFQIFQGEMIGIIGPNGEGKTTALKLAMGFLAPNQGTVLINAQPPQKQRTHIGYVSQFRPYDKKFPISVLEVVLTGAVSEINWLGRFPEQIKKRALTLLKELEIDALAETSFGSLSGGQTQKVLLARALMCNPSILFLDEPTAHIDPQSEDMIFHLLKTFSGTKTIVIVTHNFDAILRHMSRVLCFQSTVSSLKPEEVCEHFALGMYHPTERPHDH
ncbi:MAG: ABC transporter ATP-binding protein [Chlamydiota bacterium]